MYLFNQMLYCKTYGVCVSFLRTLICGFISSLVFCHANFFLALVLYKEFRTELRIKTCTFNFQCHVTHKLLKAHNILLSTSGEETAYGFKLPSYMYLIAMLRSVVKLSLASYVINRMKQIRCFYFS